MNRKLLITLIVALAAVYLTWDYYRPPTASQRRVMLDAETENNWFAEDRTSFEAIEFFESGGTYIDTDAKTSEHIDRDVMLPLAKLFQEKYSAPSKVVVSDKDEKWAVAMFVELPKDRTKHAQMMEEIERADEGFSGIILTGFGNRWLSIDALDAEMAAPLLARAKQKQQQ